MIFKYTPIDNRMELSSYSPHQQNMKHESSTLIMGAEKPLEKSGYYYQTLRHYLPTVGFEKGGFLLLLSDMVSKGSTRTCKRTMYILGNIF